MTRPAHPNHASPSALAWAGTTLTAAFAFLFATTKIHDFDTWWHLRTGEWIIQNRAIPRVDPFSFTTEGTPWIAHYWLSDVLFAWVHHISGVDGLILMAAAVVAATFAIVHRLMVARGVDPFRAALLLGAAVVAARFRFMVRPQVFMFLFSAIFLWVASSDLEKAPRRLLLLFPVMLLWVQMHGSFVLALVFIGALLADRIAVWALHRKTADPTPFPLLVGATFLGLCVLTFASPYGAALPAWVLRDFTSHAVTRSFQLEEHMALAWGNWPLVWGFLLAAVASFVLAGRRARVFDGLVTLAFAALALRSQRFGALGSIMFAVVIGVNVTAWLERHAPSTARPAWSLRSATGAVVVLVAAGLTAFKVTFTPDKAYAFGLGIIEGSFPGATVSFLEDLGIQGNVLNTWELGGYLLWRTPGLKTFADGRTLDGHVDAVERTRAMTPPELTEWILRNDVAVVIVKRNDQPYAGFAASSSMFKLVTFDDLAVVYLRDDLYERLASSGRVEAFRWIRPDSWDTSYLATLAVGKDAADVEAELRRAAAISPGSVQPLFLLGCFLEAQGRPEALDAFDAATEANPRLAFTHLGLGLRAARLALRLGEWNRAAAMAQRTLAYGTDGETYFVLGTAAQMAGDLDEAEQAFRKALKKDPGNATTLVNLGFVYLDSGRAPLAVQAFSEAIRGGPVSENALYGLALSSQRSGSVTRAADMWREFLARFPNSRWTANARRFLAETGEGS